MPTIKTLADFKRVLATPGVMLQCFEHSYLQGRKPADDPFWKPRTIRKVRSKDVQINIEGRSQPSHLDFGAASRWTFDGDVARLQDDGLTMAYRIIYPVEN